jgi:hypothetical protein
LPGSDTDIKGVYILPKEIYYGFGYVEQVNNESNDIVFYELKRFMELLLRNNPNLLELLDTPADCVLYKHPLMEHIQPELFLSKLCKNSFANYAFSQIKKAKGLNKKIYNPVDKERKSILEFCYVTAGSGSQPLRDWLEKNNIPQESCGLASINHIRDLYALYYNADNPGLYKGILQKENANDVVLSSIPKTEQPLTWLFFNKDGYSVYCRDYKEYWEWVANRNELRYENTLEHGKNYDAKNMQHVFRLLNMADEIATEQKIHTFRKDRDWLLSIRQGKFQYEELMQLAEEKLLLIEQHFAISQLPEMPDPIAIERLLVEMRQEWYAEKDNTN